MPDGRPSRDLEIPAALFLVLIPLLDALRRALGCRCGTARINTRFHELSKHALEFTHGVGIAEGGATGFRATTAAT